MRPTRSSTVCSAALTAVAMAGLGCSTATPEGTAGPLGGSEKGPAGFELTARDFERPWIRLPAPAGGSLEGLTRGSEGRFFALLRESHQMPNGGKVSHRGSATRLF